MAVDVDQILKYVVYEQGSRVKGPSYPVLPWYNNNYKFKHTWRTGPKKGQTEEMDFIPFNTEESKALLAEAGYVESGGKLKKDNSPLRLNFVFAAGTSPRKDTAMLVREQWEKLGLELDFQEYEWNVYIGQYIMPRKFDVCVLGWSGGLDFDSRQLWHSTSLSPDGMNFVGYANPEADKLMETLVNTYDPQEQIRLSRKVFDTIAADFPYVFLYSGYSTTVVDRHIVWRRRTGVNPDGSPQLTNSPLDHDDIRNARASFLFWERELLRLDDMPEFKPEDRRR